MSLQWQGGEEKEGPIGDFDATYSFSNVLVRASFRDCELIVPTFQGPRQPSGLPKGKRCHR